MEFNNVKVLEAGYEIDVSFDGCIMYHGVDSIGGLALGFRLMKWAIEKLSPEKAPERSTIRFATAFPGPGLRDAVEMVSRAVTRGAYTVLTEAPDIAPEGVYGHMYFEISVGEKTLKVCLAPGVFSEEFISVGRAYKRGETTPELLTRWKELKEDLARSVWSADLNQILVEVK